MKKALYVGLMFLFVLSLGACAGDKQPAIQIKDATSKTRFTVSPDGVISDAGTGLEWVTGPNQPTTYPSAENWVNNCKMEGGGWRLPTVQELKTLYLPGVGTNNMDPAFKTSALMAWAGPSGSMDAPTFSFFGGNEGRLRFNDYADDFLRVFGVRSRPK